MNNWKPVVSNLIEILEKHNLEMVLAYDGEEEFFNPSEFVDVITSVDDSELVVKAPDYHNDIPLTIILGNGPHEIVADWRGNSAALENALDEFSEIWESKEVPTV